MKSIVLIIGCVFIVFVSCSFGQVINPPLTDAQLWKRVNGTLSPYDVQDTLYGAFIKGDGSLLTNVQTGDLLSGTYANTYRFSNNGNDFFGDTLAVNVLIGNGKDVTGVLWSSLDKTGSSLSDLSIRSASDLNTGTLPNDVFPSILPALDGSQLFNVPPPKKTDIIDSLKKDVPSNIDLRVGSSIILFNQRQDFGTIYDTTFAVSDTGKVTAGLQRKNSIWMFTGRGSGHRGYTKQHSGYGFGTHAIGYMDGITENMARGAFSIGHHNSYLTNEGAGAFGLGWTTFNVANQDSGNFYMGWVGGNYTGNGRTSFMMGSAENVTLTGRQSVFIGEARNAVSLNSSKQSIFMGTSGGQLSFNDTAHVIQGTLNHRLNVAETSSASFVNLYTTSTNQNVLLDKSTEGNDFSLRGLQMFSVPETLSVFNSRGHLGFGSAANHLVLGRDEASDFNNDLSVIWNGKMTLNMISSNLRLVQTNAIPETLNVKPTNPIGNNIDIAGFVVVEGDTNGIGNVYRGDNVVGVPTVRPQYMKKKIAQTTYSSDQLEDDPDLWFEIGVNERWTFEFVLFYMAHDDSDFKVHIKTTPNNYYDYGIGVSALDTTGLTVIPQANMSGLDKTFEIGGAMMSIPDNVMAIIKGTITGDPFRKMRVQLQCAQRVSHPQPAILDIGSYLIATRLPLID